MHGDRREPILSRVLRSVPDAVMAVDAEDRVIVWNRAAEALFGWSADEVLGGPLPNIPDEEAWAARSRWIAQVSAGGRLETRAQRHHKDGQLLDVVIRYEALRAGDDVVGIVTTCRHATTEVRLEQVDSERQQVEAMLDAMHDGFAVVRDGVVVTWNRAAAELTGHRTEDVVGRPPPLPLESGAVGLEVSAPDHTHWIQTVSTSLPATGEVIYLIRDITEQHKLDVAKDLFFAATSHELKTPLTVVKGLAATMHQHWQKMTDEHRAEAIETILRRVDQLDMLIDRILVGSRVSAGVLDVQVGPTELAPVIVEMARSFDAVSSRHEVRAELPDHLPLVAGDRQALDTVLGHLLENAVKYSPDGGAVVVTARAAGDAVEVDVLDEGIGIEGDLEQLLLPFVQGERRVARRFGGVGIGLFIVRQLVEALDGTLTATNRAEGGARVGFTLPVWR